jgi:hypothetical protein
LFQRVAIFSLGCLPSLALVVSCSSEAPSVPGDAAVPVDSSAPVPQQDGGADAAEGGTDATAADAAFDSSSDSTLDAAADSAADSLADSAADSPVDAGVDSADWPRGTVLVKGDVLTLQGVTSDDYAIYIDGLRAMLSAVSLSGGMPMDIAPVDPAAVVQVSGPVVVAWTKINTSSGSGTLTMWTAAHGTHVLSTSSQVGYYGLQGMAVSPDGSKVAFYDQLTASGSSGTLDLIGVDGSGLTTLLASVDLSNGNCLPVFQFVGENAFVVASESPGGSPTVTKLTGAAGAAWTATTLVQSPSCTFAVDPSGAWVLATSASGLAGYSLGDAGALPIDPVGQAGVFARPLDAGGGEGGAADEVVYLDTSGGLRRAPFASTPSPTVLVDGGLQRILAVSGNGSWVLANEQTSMQGYVDMYLASTRAPGPLTALLSGPTGVLVGDPFTADSDYALYGPVLPPDAGQNGFFLFAAPTAAPPPTDAGAGVGRNLAFNVITDFATGGSKVVFSTGDPRNPVVFDIFSADLSTGAPPTRLVTRGDSPFFLSAAKDKIVFTWSLDYAPIAGLYVQELP